MRNLIIVIGCVACASLNAQPQQRFHPTKHFESFSDVSFELRKSASASGSHRGGGRIAMADDKVNIQGTKVHPKPVTNAEYYNFVKATGHAAPSHWQNGTYEKGKDSSPVVNVSYKDAEDYAKWANKRLPNRDEWLNSVDNFSLDIETPKHEWTSSMSGQDNFILNTDRFSSTMNPAAANMDTGFRVAVPSLNLSAPRDEFETPAGDAILPDDTIQRPDGETLQPDSGNPSDFGE